MKTKIFYEFYTTSEARDADPISVGLIAVTDDEIKTFYAEFTDYNNNKYDDWVRYNVISTLPLKRGVISDNSNQDTCNVRLRANTESIIFHLKRWLSQFDSIEFWSDFDSINKPILIDLIADWNTKNKVSSLFTTIQFTNTLKAVHHSTASVIELIKETRDNPYNELEKSSFFLNYAEFDNLIGNIIYKIGLPKYLPNVAYDQFFDVHTLFKAKGLDTNTGREEFIGIKEKGIPIELQHLIDSKNPNALFDSYVTWKCYEKLMSI
jgi:hypothetical protein